MLWWWFDKVRVVEVALACCGFVLGALPWLSSGGLQEPGICKHEAIAA